MYAEVLKNVSISNTLAISDKARELRLNGFDVISLSMGEPDYDTPENIKNAAIKAMQNGYTKYTAVKGIPDLISAISKKLLKENNLNFDKSEIIVCNGGKQAIFNALFVTLNPFNNVVIPAPYWVSYPDMVSLTGASYRIVGLKENGSINLDELEKSIDKNTRWLILNSPSNPSGKVYTDDELRSIADILISKPHVSILSDDVYENFIYDGIKFNNILNIAPELAGRVLVVNSFSKTYSMTGWRIGYAAGPKELIDKMATLQSQSTSCVCSISQYAAIEALENCSDFLEESRKTLSEKRDFTINELNKIKNVNIVKPSGAFYIMIPCKNFIKKTTKDGLFISNDTELASFLLQKHLIAVVPGVDFGASGEIRISYATSFEILKKAIERINVAFNSIDV